METKNLFNGFTKQYQLSKTLRFELKPQGETEKLVRQLFEKPEQNHHEIIHKDLEFSKSYKNVKKLIDCMHRNIIDDVLSAFKFEEKELEFLNKKIDYEDDNSGTEQKDNLAKLRGKVAKELDAKSKIMFNNKLLNPGSKNEDNEEGTVEVKKNKKKVKGKSVLEVWMNNANKKYLELSGGKKLTQKI